MSQKRLRTYRLGSVVGVGLVTLAAASWLAARSLATKPPADSPAEPIVAVKHHPVTIRQPTGRPVVASGETDLHGQPLYVSCGTCHDTRTADVTIKTADQLKDFHQGLSYNHGGLSCLSCHNADDYETFRLADSSSLPYGDSLKLCAQCHGPQFRDYQHGAHGGMNGYWDLTRGPRFRNHCLDCHDPHHPAYPQVHPVFPPRDRGAKQNASSESDHE